MICFTGTPVQVIQYGHFSVVLYQEIFFRSTYDDGNGAWTTEPRVIQKQFRIIYYELSYTIS